MHQSNYCNDKDIFTSWDSLNKNQLLEGMARKGFVIPEDKTLVLTKAFLINACQDKVYFPLQKDT